MAIKYSIIVGTSSELPYSARVALTVQGFHFSPSGLDIEDKHYFVGEKVIGNPNPYQEGRITKIRENTIHGVIHDGLDELLKRELKIPEQ